MGFRIPRVKFKNGLRVFRRKGRIARFVTHLPTHTVNITCSLMHKTTHPSGGRATAAATAVSKPKNDVVSAPIPSLPLYHHGTHHQPPAANSTPFMVTAVSATSSWLRSRRIRYLFLFLCSPLILLLLCAALPFLCAAELCRRCHLWGKLFRNSADDERQNTCGEGCGGDEERGLLHRYLEDQLLLVGSVYECGEDEEEEEFRRVEDIENLGSGRIPLLG